jgi:predicted AlkP superfamily pyrophosphatase or phosphodiesterase
VIIQVVPLSRVVCPLWFSLLGLLAALPLVASEPPSPVQAQPPKLVLISWDGAPDWIVDRLLAEGQLPNLAALAARGAAVEHSLSTFPSKTAVAHATLWTGAWPGLTGITSNRVSHGPDGQHTLLETRRGFSSLALQAEPLYVTAARAGRKVVLLSATHSHPPDPHLEVLRRNELSADRFLTFSGFENLITPGRMFGPQTLSPRTGDWGRLPPHEGIPLELEFEVGDSTFHGLVYDSLADPKTGYDRLLLRQGTRGAEAIAQAILEPRPASDPPTGWSPAFRIRHNNLQGGTFFRLFELSPDGSRFALYQWQASGLDGAHRQEDLEGYLKAYPAFHDDAFARYRRGQLGNPIPDGGDGTAEERLLEIVAHDTQLLMAGTRFGLAQSQPDLLWHYSPMSDSAGHIWMGILDPGSPTHDPLLAQRLWPFYVQVFRHLDRWLGDVLQHVDDNTVVALVTDHGMEGSGQIVNTNYILEEAGLLTRGPEGRIDLAHTKVLGAEAAFYLRLNTTSRKGGVVSPEEYQAALQEARRALLNATDPHTGQWLYSRVLPRQELTAWGLDHPNAGDLYLDPMPGFYPSPQKSMARTQPFSNGAWGSGTHGFWPVRRKMHAIFYLAGPGVTPGVLTPPIRHVDVAPTLAHLLGLPAPAQSLGKVIEELLQSPLDP